ncbi:outer membrane protein assembly factor BamA [Bradyrhizobium neotropicale]|uniref:outer membrane protein assembly factor BamA n=1 Tax=Bradyrhizobium neotropicale TaxID=1497615 RepID=UPI001AD7C3E5|nr:outer membrane protein assembly factor BamA [Bradyrhizobium neotropicale]MBO4223636.1 outer membrane protein assembly factor BamA [Bradyrhizobium neotropicale]
MRHRFARHRQFDIVGQWETARDVKLERITLYRQPSRLRLIGSVLVAAAALLNAAAPLAAEGVPAPTATIIVEGNRRVEADTVRSYFHPGPDGRLDEAARDEALKALVATGLFEKVSIERTGNRLTVRVAEAPILDRVAFEGNRKIKDADLAAAIESKPHGSLQRATVQSDVGRIIEAYRHAGRDDVRVAPEIIDRGNGRVNLVYVITEGAKTPVRQIKFVGNRTFGAGQLNAVIKTSATNMLSFLTGSDVYDPDRVAQDQERLRLYYRSKGYADAAVRSATAEYDPAAKGFAVTFVIDEGPLYHFGDVSIACNIPGLDPQKLRGVALARAGAVFDGNALDKSTELLAVEMAKLGYPFAQAVTRIARDAAAQRIDVTFVIDQGPRTYVERIEIHGNTHTRDYVIRREFDIAEGDPYNKTLIDRAERRLKNLNYFKTVKVSNRPGSTPDRVVLDVETVEQATGEFNISGGYSSTDGALVEVKAGDRNFYGTGNNVQASVSYGQYARGIDLAASEPYFLGTKVSAGIELFGRQSEVSSYQSYNSTTYGSTLQLGTPITEQFGVQWRYSIYNQDISLGPTSSGLPPSLAVQQAAANGPAWVSAVGSTSTYSTLDNNKSPTSGLRSQLSQDLAGLGGDVKFLRTSEDARYYQSLAGDLVGMVRAQGGYVIGWGGQQVPLMNSFFGGPNMVRGFATNGFGPRDLTPGTTMDNVGGSAYWATTAELQSGIPGVPDEYGLKASAFVDAGSVFRYSGPTSVGGTALQVGNKNVVRSSVGMGLTWASPFGALTVDYALPLTKAAYDVVQPLRFSAGGF